MPLMIDIEIWHKGACLRTAASKPVRRMPSGASGVVHAGRVYPLRRGDRIDLGDETEFKNACPAFVEHETDIVYQADDEEAASWCFETTRRGSYVAFDGERQDAERLFDELETEGLAQRLGESFRPAKDGTYYDWFIHMSPGADEEAAERILRSVFEASELETAEVSSNGDAATMDRLRDAETELRDMRLELTGSKIENLRLIVELETSQAAAQRTDMALRAAEAARDGYRETADAARRSHRKSITRRRSLADRPEAVGKEAQAPRDLSLDLEEALNLGVKEEQAKQAVEAELDAARSDIREREARVVELEAELTEAKREQSDLQRALNSPTRGSGQVNKGYKRLIDKMSKEFLPRLELTDEDIELLTQIEKPATMLKHLLDIDRGDGDAIHPCRTWQNGGRRLRGIREISKVHIGVPGSHDMGRIYFRPIEGERVEVALHRKTDEKDQAAFVRRRFG